MDLFVGNLSYDTTEDTLYDLFLNYGAVEKVKVVKDFHTGRSRGFAFVTMTNLKEAQAAIEALNGSSVDGRTIQVNQAERKERRSGGSGGGGGGGGHREGSYGRR